MFAERRKVQLRFEGNLGGEERKSWHERIISRASLEQEARSVKSTKIDLAEEICSIANHFECCVTRQNFFALRGL